ncbi:MAG: hypothetical protein U1C46_11970, partial [Bacteroidales bacterium]|nr:hypothetical protein [Bacteroidales bacterium]
MPDKIIITEGSWWILLCIIAGLLYAAVLYLYERRFEFSSSRRYLMATIRTVAVSLIAFFLLSPFFRHSTSTVSKPIVIMAQENSASVLAGKDSSFYKRQYPELLNQLVSSLERNFEVHRYSFGQMVSPDITFTFDEKQTNISKLISDLHSLYINRNVGAVILASDGIYNQGVHPYYAVQQMPYPFFTVAMGDTTPQRDALIVRVLHNRIAYLGNSFPVEIQIRGSLCNGLKSRLQVLHKGAALFAENISFEGDKYDKIIQVELKASEPGLHRYTVSLQPIVGEITTTNNVKDFFVDVFEGKQKVLMLYSAPHPDIAAIRQSLDSHQNYEITVSEISHFKENPALYNLVILHQLPSARSADGQLLQQMRDQNIPLLFIIGIGTSVDIFNTLQTGLTITGGGIKLNEALPAMNPAFGLFSLSQEFRDLSRYLPPLFSPFGAYRTTGAASVIFQQQIGSVVTDMPLM